MDLLQATGSPVIVMYGTGRLSIPKFEMEDVLALSGILKTERVAAQTKDMDEATRSQHLAMYPPLPPDMVEIKRYVRTPEGMVYVCRKCLPKATLSPENGDPRPLSGEEIDRIVKRGVATLGPLSWEIADLEEVKIAPPKIEKKAPEGNS